MNWHDYFTYDPETGNLVWRDRPSSDFRSHRSWRVWLSRYSGKVAGWTQDGYVINKVNGRSYRSQRIIWEMEVGPIPSGLVIDHVNGIRGDNRLSNLRLASKAQNSMNKGVHSNSASGVPGVRWHKLGNAYQARVNGRHLGLFPTIEEAKAERDRVALIEHGEYAKTK